MNAESINRWLTLGANLGVLIGIVLLLVELNQNATVMKAQISNERSNQAIGIFMTVANSPTLSIIDAKLKESGFPEETSAIGKLSPGEKHQYYSFLSAQRIRIENVLYQQTLGVVHDPEALLDAKMLLTNLQSFALSESSGRLQQLISEVDKMPVARMVDD